MVLAAAAAPSVGRRGGGCGTRGCRWLERARGHLWRAGVVTEVVGARQPVDDGAVGDDGVLALLHRGRLPGFRALCLLFRGVCQAVD